MYNLSRHYSKAPLDVKTPKNPIESSLPIDRWKLNLEVKTRTLINIIMHEHHTMKDSFEPITKQTYKNKNNMKVCQGSSYCGLALLWFPPCGSKSNMQWIKIPIKLTHFLNRTR